MLCTKLSKEANCKLTEGQFEEMYKVLLEFPRENGFDKVIDYDCFEAMDQRKVWNQLY